MRRRALVLISVFAVLVGMALPAFSSWRVRAGRTRCAEEAVARLGACSTFDRDRAERALVDLGIEALPFLTDLPVSSSAEVALRARRAATSIRRAAGLDRESDWAPLYRALGRGRRPPEATLERLGSEATPVLIAAARLRADNPDLLRLAVEHASRWGGRGASTFLTRTVGDKDVPAATISLAADGLIRRATPENLEHIRALLSDPVSARRAAAVRILVAHGIPDDRTLLVEALTDPNPVVRAQCAGLIGVESTRARALTLLADPEARVRALATRHLGGVRDTEMLATLCGMLEDPSGVVRMAAVRSLAAAGQVTRIAELAKDPSFGVRLAVHKAMGSP
jgi:HEAT repeat protein